MDIFYILVNGQTTGPFDMGTLSQKVAEGVLTKETIVYKQGAMNWAQASTLPELQPLFNAPPVPPIPTIPPIPPTPLASANNGEPLGLKLVNMQFVCSKCDHTLSPSELDKNLIGTCKKCGSIVTATKEQLKGTSEVVNSQKNAVRFFKEHNFETALHYAKEILSYADDMDNAVALFIIAYYEAYVTTIKSRDELNKFFNETLAKINFATDELEAFKEVLQHAVYQVEDYEKVILKTLLEKNGAEATGKFIEEFSPYLINKRNSIEWFDAEMCSIYADISAQADIPKTWYALFQGITKNPESPEASQSYHLKTATLHFYNQYVLGVGKIFSVIKNDALKAKFGGAFNQIKTKIEFKMN